jgi:hypothetical protein
MNVITRLPHLNQVALPASGAWTTLALALPSTHKAYVGGPDTPTEGVGFTVQAGQTHATFWPVYTRHASSTTGFPVVRLQCSNGTEQNAELLVDEEAEFTDANAAQTVYQRQIHLWTPPDGSALAYGPLVFEVHAYKTIWLQAAEAGDVAHPGSLAILIGGHS